MINSKSFFVGGRAVTVTDFYHRGGNGPTTAGGVVLWYIYNSEMPK